MSVGLQVSKAELDSSFGSLAKSFQKLFDQVEVGKAYLDATPDANLVALGYTSGEVATLKTAVNDLNQLRNIWLGTANLSTNKDFTTFVRQLWGLGAF